MKNLAIKNVARALLALALLLCAPPALAQNTGKSIETQQNSVPGVAIYCDDGIARSALCGFGGPSRRVAVTPTLTAGTAYTAGQEAGSKLVFSGLFGSSNSGILQSIRIGCRSVQTTGWKVTLFRSDPSNTTWTDRTNASITAADVPAVIGTWTLSTAESPIGTMTSWTLDGIGASIVSTSASLWAVLTVTGTPTFASTGDCTASLNVLPDTP